MDQIKRNIEETCKTEFTEIDPILKLDLSQSKQDSCIIWNVFEGNISLDNLKDFIISYSEKRKLSRINLLSSTAYKRFVCVYDYCKYGDNHKSKDTMNR